MTIKDAEKQLTDLKIHCKSMIDKDDKDDIWQDDVKAIGIALFSLKLLSDMFGGVSVDVLSREEVNFNDV